MEADIELRNFLRSGKNPPTGFEARVIRACRYNSEWIDGKDIDSPVKTIDQLHKCYKHLVGVGPKSVEHIRYLFELREKCNDHTS